jgi:GH25 family lysozyme M1 (1,4-beta-N-acetylmuramidase)
MSSPRAVALAAVVALGLTSTAAAGGAAAAATARTAVTARIATAARTATAARAAGAAAGATAGPAGRGNVGNTHSPELENLLAGHATATPRGRAAGRAASVAPGASDVLGVDVASFQHPDGAAINWADVAGAGYRFAFVKATEGSYYVNPYAEADLAAAKAAGLYAAPYHFAIPNYSGGALQADYALDQSGYASDGRTLPVILDIEYDPYVADDHTNTCYGLTRAQMVSWISAFTAEAFRRTGQRPVIYTTAQWWDECTGDSAAFTADPLWIAGYTASGPPMPAAWASWAYWQYTSSASVPGIGGGVDASYLNAAALELLEPPAQSQVTGHAVSLQLAALAATAPASYAAAGLPPGLSIDPATGRIAGTLPARAGAFRVTVTATPSSGPAVRRAFSWDVHGAVSLGRPRAERGTVGSAALLRVRVRDALPGCTLQLAATGLPPGLSMSSCGLVTGWLRASGRYRVHVRASDSAGRLLASVSFSWQVSRAPAAGPAGQIRRGGGGCLERVGTGSGVGTGRCTAAARQRWVLAADGTIRQGGRCLAQAGPAVALGTCARTGAVRWQAGSPGELINVTSGRCLTAAGSRPGIRAVAVACTGGAAQQWLRPAGPLTAGIAGFCASDKHRRRTALGPVTLQRCATSAQQSWTIEPDGTVRTGGQCLGLQRGATAYGTAVVLGPCRSAPSQTWQLSGGPVGAWLVNSLASLCLAVPGDRAASGTALTLGWCQAADPGISWRTS